MSRGRPHRQHQRPESMPFTEIVVDQVVRTLYAVTGAPPSAKDIATRVRRDFPRRDGSVSPNDIIAVRRCLKQLVADKKVREAGEGQSVTGRRPALFAPIFHG